MSKEEYDSLLSMLPNEMTGSAYFNMYSIIRKRRLIRWSPQELKSGVKVISSDKENYTVSLKDTIAHPTITKIDIWVKINNRWIEMTNLYLFTFKNSASGVIEPVGFKFTMKLEETAEIDIRFYSSPEHEKPYKLSKRIWNRAILNCYRAVENGKINWSKIDPTQWHILKKIYPLFAADINRLSQIVSDLELFGEALKKRKEKNISYSFMFKYLLTQVDTMPGDLFRLVTLGRDDKETDSIQKFVKKSIDSIFEYIHSTIGVENYRDISDNQWDSNMTDEKVITLVSKLDELRAILRKKQNEYIKSYLIANKLHPRQENTIVNFEYTENYLKLPPVTEPKTTYVKITQRGSGANYYKKYLKYKHKYLKKKQKLGF